MTLLTFILNEHKFYAKKILSFKTIQMDEGIDRETGYLSLLDSSLYKKRRPCEIRDIDREPEPMFPSTRMVYGLVACGPANKQQHGI